MKTEKIVQEFPDGSGKIWFQVDVIEVVVPSLFHGMWERWSENCSRETIVQYKKHQNHGPFIDFKYK